MRDSFLNRLEQTVRAALGLPEDPDSGPFEGPNENGLFLFRPQTDEEQEASFRHYHEQPLLGHLVGEGFRYLRLAQGYIEDPDKLVDRLTWPTRKLLIEQELAEARTICWKSWHTAIPGETTHLDGYLELGDGERKTLDIQALGEQREWARESWRDGGVTVHTPGDAGVETIVCPVRALTPFVVDQAIRRWYMERFEWKRGHWAVLERTLPAFEIDDSFWGWPDNAAAKARYGRYADKADQTISGLQLSDWGRRLQQRFGA